jgi:hypothetical protein
MTNEEILQKIMDDNCISPKEFGNKIGKNDNFVSTIKTGAIRQLTPKVIRAILDAFPQYSPDWLRTGEPPIYVDKPVAISGNGNVSNIGNGNSVTVHDRILTLLERQTEALAAQIAEKDKQINDLISIIKGAQSN